MEISWYGHSCFRVKGREVTLVTDPFQEPGWSYPPLALEADVVTVSHEHPHHAAVDAIGGRRRVLHGPGEYEIGGAMLWGVQTYRRPPEAGQPRRRNTSFLLKLEDVLVCHLGDLGTPLTPDQLEVLKDAQVLLVPVGGRCALGAAEAVEAIAQIEPRLIVPMHFGTSDTPGLDLEGVERFCAEMGATGVVPQARLMVTSSSLPAEPTVVLLEPRR